MAGPFEIAARAAIEDLIQTHCKISKYGLVMTQEGAKDLIESLYQLLVTSRNLKSMGDRMLLTPETSSPGASQNRAGAKPSPFGRKPGGMNQLKSQLENPQGGLTKPHPQNQGTMNPLGSAERAPPPMVKPLPKRWS